MKSTISHTLLLDYVLKQSLDIICTIDREGKFIYINEACRRVLGFEPCEMVNRSVHDFVLTADHEKTANTRMEVIDGDATTAFENRIISKDGKEITISWSAVWSAEENVIICIGRDITEQVAAKRKVKEKEDFYQALVEHGSDMLALLDEEGNYKFVGNSTSKILGYDPEQLIGINALSLIHEDDVPKAFNTLQKLLAEGGTIPLTAFRYKNTAGEWRWLETVASNQLQNPSIKSIIVNSRDITDPILNKLQLKESEQRFRALFENNPDMIFFEDTEGVILNINPSVLSFFNSTREDVIGRSIADFLPKDAADLCDEKRLEALTGQKVKFEMELKIAGLESMGDIYLDISKIPVEINGTVAGIYTIARDITAIKHSQDTIRLQARKLNNIFESITDAFFTIDKDWNFTYLNKECERLLGLNKEESVGKNVLKVFPEEENGEFQRQYEKAIRSGSSVNFEAYLKRTNRWLEVRAFPSKDVLSVYFADVTERVHTERELEKLSLVASKTSNGVVILDALGYAEWVNDGFTRITGFAPSDIIGKKPREVLYGPDTDLNTAQKMFAKMEAGQTFTGELLNYKKSGEEVWISLNLTPVTDSEGKITKYISIITDITDMMKYRQKLKELSLVASTSTNGVFITNADRRIEWVNDGFTRLTGFTLDEVLGYRPSELLHSEKTPTESFRLAKEKMLNHEPVAFEVQYRTKSQDDIWVSAEVNPILNEQGKLTRFIATLTDITALKKSELELTQLTKDLYRHNRDMQQFTYIVSHNLRSPVANAIGLTNLLSKVDKNSEAFDKSLNNLKKSVSQLDIMLKDLNTILSVKDVKDTFTKEDVELNQVLQQVLLSLQEPLENCGGKLSINIPEPYFVSGNRAYLHSIFYNLISNAIKYKSEERSLLIGISCYSDSTGETVLSISDNGSGIDLGKAGSKLFRLYNRFHAGTTEGRGIGLFLVKTHVEALGGTVEVESEVNQGTTFTIKIKLRT